MHQFKDIVIANIISKLPKLRNKFDLENIELIDYSICCKSNNVNFQE